MESIDDRIKRLKSELTQIYPENKLKDFFEESKDIEFIWKQGSHSLRLSPEEVAHLKTISNNIHELIREVTGTYGYVERLPMMKYKEQTLNTTERIHVSGKTLGHVIELAKETDRDTSSMIRYFLGLRGHETITKKRELSEMLKLSDKMRKESISMKMCECGESISAKANKCKECSARDRKEYQKRYQKKWREDNKGYHCKKVKEHYNKNYNIDERFTLKKSLRSLTFQAFKNKSYTKDSTTMEILGADYQTVKELIESKFTKGMSWDNRGDWHIDHIIPLAAANSVEELKALCHYTNLQPLWAFENMSKSDSYEEHDKVEFLNTQ